MTDFYSETVKRLADLEARMRLVETREKPVNIWIRRRKILPVAANVLDAANGVCYVVMDPTPAVTDLNTINNGSNGQVLILRVEGAADTVTIKDGVGNISIPASGDIVLSDEDMLAMLLFDESVGVSGTWLGFCCP